MSVKKAYTDATKESLQEKYDMLSSELSQLDIPNLKSTLESSQTKLALYEQRLIEERGRCGKLEIGYQQLQTAYRSLEGGATHLEERVSALQAEVSALQAEADRYKAECNAAKQQLSKSVFSNQHNEIMLST